MTGPLPLKILCLLLVQSIFPVHSAELPCPTSLAVNVTVGGVPAYISATNELLHGQSQGRQCSSVKEGWTGLVMLRCANGILSAVVNCTGQPCGVYRTTSVTLGPITGTITPPFELVSSSPWDDTSATPQLVYGERLCGSVNENYRGIIKLRCVEGVLLTDIDACEPQWTQTSTAFPATPRSQSQAVTLGDGAILLLGGFDTTSRTNDNWLWRPSHNDSQYYDELTREVGPPDSYDPHGGSWKKLVLPSGGVPWQPRLGHSAVRVYTESIEDDRVMLLAGSAGEMMNDVWMWTRKPLRRQLPIASHLSRLVGVSPRGCSLDDGLIECVTDLGPVGRRLAIDEDWRRCTAFETEIMVSGESMDALLLRLEISSPNCTVELRSSLDGSVKVSGCLTSTWQSSPGLLTNDTWFDIGFEFAWSELRVQLRLNGVALTNLTLDAARAPMQQAVGLNAVHWVAWQEPWSSSSARGTIRARKHTITLQPGMWTQLVAEAPWVARTQAAVTAMRDGTVMLFGGEGDERLNDVWRWIPFTCAYPHSNTSGLDPHASPAVEDAAEIENQYLAQFEVECNAVISANRTCRPSIQGQWVSVSAAAPFSARSGATAVELKDGSVLLLGGFDGAFTNDIWRWSAGSSSPQICTTAWKGSWEQISAAAPWDPRYGMSSINLYSPGQWDSDAVVVFGGFGKASKSSETLIVGRGVSVQLSGSKTLFNDVWCYEGGQWSRITQEGPLTKRYHAAFTRFSNDSFVVLGGYDENTRPTADVWRWKAEPANGELCSVEVLS